MSFLGGLRSTAVVREMVGESVVTAYQIHDLNTIPIWIRVDMLVVKYVVRIKRGMGRRWCTERNANEAGPILRQDKDTKR